MIDFQSFLAEIAKAPLQAKVTAVLTLLAIVGVLGIAGVFATRPHYVTLYSGLDDAERVAVEKALAGVGVSFRTSQPPGPYVLYVDDGAQDEAQIAVALAEALKRTPSGIDVGESGTSTIFMAAGERQQRMLKREWQEAEQLLEQLDFVSRATVKTSSPDSSPLRRKEPVTVSVALHLRGSGELTSHQATTVAKLVRYRFGVPAENVIISDQAGRILHDPTEGSGLDARSSIEQSTTYDRDLASKVNAALAVAFGEHKALVTVTSEWDYDQSTTIAETLDPEAVTLSTETSSSKTPQNGSSGVGGAVGTAANIPGGFGVDNAAFPGQTEGLGGAAPAETSDEKSVFDIGRSRKQTVRTTPRIARLSVSLVVDESLAAKREEIVELVKAAVGFDATRQDVIGVNTTTFPVPEVESEEGEVVEAPAEPNPTMELLLTRGVEIVAALAFVALLFMSLKGGKKKGAAAAAGDVGSPEAAGLEVGGESLDPALVAQAQIEELVKTNPRRVSEILSRWASDDATVGSK